MDWASIESNIINANECSKRSQFKNAYISFALATHTITSFIAETSNVDQIFNASSSEVSCVFDAFEAIALSLKTLNCMKDVLESHFGRKHLSVNTMSNTPVSAVAASPMNSTGTPSGQRSLPYPSSKTSQLSNPKSPFEKSIFTALSKIPLRTYSQMLLPPSIPQSPLLLIMERINTKQSSFQTKLQQSNISPGLSGARKLNENRIMLSEMQTSLSKVMEESKERKISSFESPVVISEALSAFFWNLFSSIRVPEDVVSYASHLHRGGQVEDSPNPLQVSLDLAGYFSGAIQHDIIRQATPVERAETLVWWGNVLRDMWFVHRNHLGAMAIVSALDSQAIKKLGETWDYVPRRSTIFIRHLATLFPRESSLNNLQYLAELNEVSPPAIPWLNVVLLEFSTVENITDQKDFLNKWILQYQKQAYSFIHDIDPVAGHWLVNLLWKSEAENLQDAAGLESKPFSVSRLDANHIDGDDFLLPSPEGPSSEVTESYEHHRDPDLSNPPPLPPPRSGRSFKQWHQPSSSQFHQGMQDESREGRYDYDSYTRDGNRDVSNSTRFSDRQSSQEQDEEMRYLTTQMDRVNFR